jgi:hypothetical protein
MRNKINNYCFYMELTTITPWSTEILGKLTVTKLVKHPPFTELILYHLLLDHATFAKNIFLKADLCVVLFRFQLNVQQKVLGRTLYA